MARAMGVPSGDPAYDGEDLPTLLRRGMRDAGYRTAVALASAAEMDPSQLGKVLKGLSRPTIPTLNRLATALKIPPSELALAAGYPAVVDPDRPRREPEDPTLLELLRLLEEDEAFMSEFSQAKPLDGEALRDMADLLRPYLAAMRRAHAARARPRREGGPV